jgi:hypothetical protein
LNRAEKESGEREPRSESESQDRRARRRAEKEKKSGERVRRGEGELIITLEAKLVPRIELRSTFYVCRLMLNDLLLGFIVGPFV